MIKQIIAFLILVFAEWGLAYFYFWYVTTGNFPLWAYFLVGVFLGILNVIILNLYASGKNADK